MGSLLYIYINIYIYMCVCVLYMFMFYVSNAGKTDEERSTEPGGILQKWMIFSGKSCKMDDLGPPKVDLILSAGFFPIFLILSA